jgi:multidrug efflux pump subunit AcrA (membrane-fusion protein)
MAEEIEVFEHNTDKDFLADKSIASKYTLRSELAQEIISRKPGFLEKWSLLVFLGILLLMFGGTWFVHYPDIITARAVIVAENGPAQITAKQEGTLAKLLVKNNDNVKRNQLIGWIENGADAEEVIKLSSQVEKSIALLAANNPEQIPAVISTNLNNLGEIQQHYEQFLLSEDGVTKFGFNKLKFNGGNDGSLRL